MNKRNWVVSLPPTAAPLMRDVKLKAVVAQHTSGSGVELSSSGGIRKYSSRFKRNMCAWSIIFRFKDDWSLWRSPGRILARLSML